MSTSFPYRHVKREKKAWIKPNENPTTGQFWSSATTWWSQSAVDLTLQTFFGGTNWKHGNFMIKDTGSSEGYETIPLNIPGRRLRGTGVAEHVGLDLTEWPEELQLVTTAGSSVNNTFVNFDQYRVEAINHMMLFRNYSETPLVIMWRIVKYDPQLSTTTLNELLNPLDEGTTTTVPGGEILYQANDWNKLVIPSTHHRGDSLFVERSINLKTNVLRIFPEKEFYGSGRDSSYSSFLVTGPHIPNYAVGLQYAVVTDLPNGQATTHSSLYTGMAFNWLVNVRKSNAA